jgi:septum formation protein
MEVRTNTPAPLVLASASPRRAALLRQVGIPFRAAAVDVDEEAAARGRRTPAAVARSRAVAKALAAARQHPEAVVLGADTVVACGRTLLDKPRDRAEAERMLRLLSGRWHTVVTAIAIVCRGELTTAVEYARVAFRRLHDDEVRAYAAGPEPLDKAGGYAIQGAAAAFVRRLVGDPTTVVGLPLCRLSVMLRPLGYAIPG